MKVKEESEKAGLKLNFQKTWHLVPLLHGKYMGKQWKQWQTSKITVDGDCSHKIKRRLLVRRKAITNLDSVLKSRDIALPTKVCRVKAMVFPVVMYECESCTIKKADCQRIDAFKCAVGEDSWESFATSRRSTHWILNEINTEYSLDCPIFIGQMLKLQYFGHLMWRVTHWKRPSCWERLRAGGEEGNRGWDGRMASLT